MEFYKNSSGGHRDVLSA